MSVRFVAAPRFNPLQPDAPQKFYATAKSRSSINLRGISGKLEEISTLSSIDTLATIEGLVTIVPREIADGNIVRLNNLGSFYLTIRSEGVDTAEDVTVATIRGAEVRFRPGKVFSQLLNNLEFVKG